MNLVLLQTKEKGLRAFLPNIDFTKEQERRKKKKGKKHGFLRKNEWGITKDSKFMMFIVATKKKLREKCTI